MGGIYLSNKYAFQTKLPLQQQQKLTVNIKLKKTVDKKN